MDKDVLGDCMWQNSDAAKYNEIINRFNLSIEQYGTDTSGISCVKFDGNDANTIIKLYEDNQQLFKYFAGFMYNKLMNVLFMFNYKFAPISECDDSMQYKACQLNVYYRKQTQYYKYLLCKQVGSGLSIVKSVYQQDQSHLSNLIGLSNIASHCYFNSALQLLIKVPFLSTCTHPALKWMSIAQKYFNMANQNAARDQLHIDMMTELKTSQFLLKQYNIDGTTTYSQIDLNMQNNPEEVIIRALNLGAIDGINTVRVNHEYVCKGNFCSAMITTDENIYVSLSSGTLQDIFTTRNVQGCGYVHETVITKINMVDYINGIRNVLFIDCKGVVKITSLQDAVIAGYKMSITALILHTGGHFLTVRKYDDKYYQIIDDANVSAKKTAAEICTYAAKYHVQFILVQVW